MGVCHYKAFSRAPDTVRQRASVDVKTVQDLMGHAIAITTLKHYARAMDQEKRDTVERLRKAL